MNTDWIRGKTAVVTGATGGIGLITAQELARGGARVTLVGRSRERGEAAVEQIRAATAGQAAAGPVDWLLADLASQAQVRRLAGEILARHPRLDLLVNNAGAFYLARQLSPEGIEMTWALNHLSYFLLTNLLLEALQRAAAESGEARVVSVSSDAHRGGRIDFDDVQFERRRFSGWAAYAQSKLGNVLFAMELARRLSGSGVTSNALHPGFVATRFAHNNGWLYRLAMKLLGRFALTPEQGAQTSLYVATAPELQGVSGRYFVRSRPAAPNPAAEDPAVARRLWELSARQVGLAA